MKKFFIVVLLLIGVFYITSCSSLENESSSKKENHTHSFSNLWSSDYEYHYHECECGEKKDIGEHDFGEYYTTETDYARNCKICGYVDYLNLNLVLDSETSSYIVQGVINKDVKKIEVPNEFNGHEVSKIKFGAFSGCKLEKIVLPFVGDKKHTESDKDQYPFGYVFGTSKSGISQQYYAGTSSGTYLTAKYAIPSTLVDVTIGDIEYLQYGAFIECKYIKNLRINSVSKIGSSAFYNCIGLESFNIPNGTVEIGNSAFKGAKNIKNISLPSSINKIGKDAFYNLYYVSAGKSSYYKSDSKLENVYYEGTFDDWSKIELGNSNSNPMRYAKSFFLMDKKGNIEYQGNKYSLSNTLDLSSCLNIGNSQFYGLSNINEIKLSDDLKEIGEYAFANIKIESIVIPKSIESFAYNSFSGCELEKIYFKGNENEWNYSLSEDDAIIYYYSDTNPTTLGHFWHYVNGKPSIWN